MKVQIKIFLIIAILLMNLNASFATTVKEARVQKIDLSFEQAYELMMANNNAIKACLQEIQAKKYEKKAAVGAYFPKIGVNSTYTHFDDDITVGVSPVKFMGATIPVSPITLQKKDCWTANVGATWNIFTGGKILALNSAARARLEGTNNKYKALTNDLTLELVKRYYGLKLAQNVVVVRNQVLLTTKKHLADAKKLESAGVIPKSERLHADVAYSQALRDYNTALRDVDIAQEGLKTLIKADNVDLSYVEIYPSSPLFMYSKEMTKLDELKLIAQKNNPNLKQMDVKKKLAQANYRSNVANYSPVITLFAYDAVAAKSLSDQVPRWGVGAMANWTLFDGLTRYNNLKAADCMRKQVKYETIDAKNNIDCLVTKNYEELLKYKEQYESTNTSIVSAKEALRTATMAFDEGLGTSLSVTDADTALSGIKIQRLNSVYNYDTTLAQLLSTKGSAEDILNYIKNSIKEEL